MSGSKGWPTIAAALIGAVVAVYAAGPTIWDQWRSRGDGLISGAPQIVPVILTTTAALLGAVALAGLLRLLASVSRRSDPDRSSDEQLAWGNTGNLYWVGHDLTYAVLALQTDLPRERVLWGLEHGLHHARSLGYRDGTVEGPLAVLVHEVSSLDESNLTSEQRAQYVKRVWSLINKIGAVSEAHQPGFLPHPPHIGFSRS